MADSLKPSSDAAWDDLDQAFFASAPPDVPQLPPEPERFDDLFPGAPMEKKREMPVALRRASAAAATAGASMQRAIRGVTGRGRPALAAAGRLTGAAWRKSSRALAAVGQGALRTARPAAARVASALRGRRLNGQAIAIAFASMILMTGLSAVIVAASRSNAHANLPTTPLERRASADRATVAEAVTPAPLPYAPAPEEPAASPAPEVQSTPAQPSAAEPELSPPAPAPSSEPHRRRAEPAKRPPVATPTPTPTPATPPPAHKHRKAASYSAERDLMVPSFVTESVARPAPPPARVAPAAPPTAPRPPAPAYTPPPAPAPRPLFSR